MSKEYNPKEQIYNKYLEEWVSPEVNREVTHFVRCNDLVKQFGQTTDMTVMELFVVSLIIMLEGGSESIPPGLGNDITFFVAYCAKHNSFLNDYIKNRNTLTYNELNISVPKKIIKMFKDYQSSFEPIPNEHLVEAINAWLTFLDGNSDDEIRDEYK